MKRKYRKKRVSIVTMVASLLISFLAGFTIVSFATPQAHAADGVQGEFAVPNLSVTFSDDSGSLSIPFIGTYYAASTCTATSNSLTVKSSALYRSGLGAEGKGTLVFKNEFSTAAQLSFEYLITKTGSGGSVTFGNESSISTSSSSGLTGTKTISLNSGGTYRVVVSCPRAESSTTVCTMSKISIRVNQNATVTFSVPTNGSYTVKQEGGTSVSVTSSDVVYSQTQTTIYSVVAKPATGYKFVCWLGDTSSETNIELSDETTTDLYITETTTIHPWFVASNASVFKVDLSFYSSFGDAIDAAKSSTTKMIIPVCNSFIPAGNYSLTNNISLLVPFAYNSVKYEYKYFDNSNLPDLLMSHTTPTCHINLTFNENAHLTLKSGSKIYVPSRVCSTGTGKDSWNGTPTGPHGRITLSNGSSITLESGASLYCFGYVTGPGDVIAKSGSIVYECFQIRCWRGGSATSGMFKTSGSTNVFPMNQYYIQNIEAFLTVYSGAYHYIYISVNANNQTYPTTAQFIGSSSGMFKITSGYLKKYYDGENDMLCVDLYGKMNIQSFSMTMMGQTVDTKYYVLPLTNNMSIHLVTYMQSGSLVGSTCSVSGQNACFLPGSRLEIDEKSKFTIGADSGSTTTNLYLYSAADWKGKSFAAPDKDIVPVGYSTVNGTTEKRNANNLEDVEVNVNGELIINSKGNLYTTGSTSNIYSSEGTGSVTISGTAPSSGTTSQVTQSGTDINPVNNISIVPAKLKNGSQAAANYDDVEEYTSTAGYSNKTFYYSKRHAELDYTYGWWNPGQKIESVLTLTFVKEDGTSFSEEVFAGSPYNFPSGEVSVDGYTQKYWYAEGTDLAYSPGVHFDALDNIGDQIFVAKYGGWFINANKYLIYEEDTPTFATGLYQIKESDGTNQLYAGTASVEGGDYCLFSLDFEFLVITTVFYFDSAVYSSGDDKPYYIRNGVRTIYNGWYVGDNGHTYYFDNNYLANANGRYLIDGTYYQFNRYGWLIEPYQIIDGLVYSEDGITLVRGFGLFSLTEGDNTYLYYNLVDGSIVRNTTFYVNKTNNYAVDEIEIQPGLYYFDANGRMYYGNEIIEGHEFDVISSGVSKVISNG